MSSSSAICQNHIPCASDGQSYYGNNTQASKSANQTAADLIQQAISEIPYNTSRPFVICEYGAADGLASLKLMSQTIRWLKEKHGTDTNIQVVYEDQPVADFKSLFYTLHGMNSSERSYLEDWSNVYVSAIATPFYRSCHPAHTVHLAYTSIAVHWLSKRPCIMKDVWHSNICTDPTERRCFAEQAAKDWETFLLLRQRELVPGGQLVLVCLARDGEGQTSNTTKYIRHSPYTVLNDIWRQMMQEGLITQVEFENASSNDYHQSAEEFAAPFRSHDSHVFKSGLRLRSIEIRLVRSPYHLSWLSQADKGDDKAREHARKYVPSIITWSHSVFKSGLLDSRTEVEKSVLLEELYRRYEDMCASEPEYHGGDLVCAYIRIENAVDGGEIQTGDSIGDSDSELTGQQNKVDISS